MMRIVGVSITVIVLLLQEVQSNRVQADHDVTILHSNHTNKTGVSWRPS